ncbi:hypothetical protein PTKIN_Ptkin16aG0033200 [Pterospermum kingtungense]
MCLRIPTYSSPFNSDSSSNSCGSNKCEDSGTGRMRDGSVSREAKHCDQGRCNIVNQKIHAQNLPSKCCSSENRLDLCTEPNDVRGKPLPPGAFTSFIYSRERPARDKSNGT